MQATRTTAYQRLYSYKREIMQTLWAKLCYVAVKLGW